ncbi:MAG TPA: biotin/lipoyl-containing protein, partial [Flavitalea sp.]|nr:biotin/lipoyl-containing protein [Flavitalea sp.]
MAIVDLVMPKLGESITEATILKWHKNPGDHVANDENILDIATDKVDTELPSSVEGIMEEQLFGVNDVVPVGAVIARIRTEAAEPVQPAPPQTPLYGENRGNGSNNFTYTPKPAAESVSNGNRFYSPLVMNIASSEGISMQELETIPGTGNEGRVSKRDILQYISERKSGNKTYQPQRSHTESKGYNEVEVINHPKQEQNEQGSFSPQLYSGNSEVIELDRMRKLIAKHMLESTQTSAHVTSFSEADVTNMVLWRERVKKEFEKR